MTVPARTLVAGAAALAAVSVWRYYEAISFGTAQWDAWHATTMAGEMGAPLRYRLISFLLPELVVRATGVAPWIAYLAERFLFLFLISVVWFRFCQRWLTWKEAVAAQLGFFALYDLTIYPHFQPSEEINIFMFLLGFIAIADRRFAWLTVVLVVGTCNKETVVFLIPAYAAFEYLRDKRAGAGLALRTAVLCIAFVAVRQGLRFAVGERPYFTDFWQYGANAQAMLTLDYRFYLFLIPSLLPALGIIWSWRRQPELMRAVAVMIPLFVGAHFAIAVAGEFRTHMPLALVTIPAVILLLRPTSGGSAL